MNHPELRQQYLDNIELIANDYLSWEFLGPQVAAYRDLIEDEVKKDTKKLSTYESFDAATNPQKPESGNANSLRGFAEQRSAFLKKAVAEQE